MALAVQEASHLTEFMEVGPGHDLHDDREARGVRCLGVHAESEDDLHHGHQEDPTQGRLGVRDLARDHQKGQGHLEGQGQSRSLQNDRGHPKDHVQDHQGNQDREVDDHGPAPILPGGLMTDQNHRDVQIHVIIPVRNQSQSPDQGRGQGQGHHES